MSCDDLVCAACAGRVSQGRCASCRASREQLHRHGPRVLPAAALLWLALLVTALLVAVGPH